MTSQKNMPVRHWLITAFALMLTSILFNPVQANEGGEQAKTALTYLYKAQINGLYAINSFYIFSANQADQAQLDAINEAVAIVDENLNELEGQLSDAAQTELLKTASKAWQNYKDGLDQNVKIVQKTGYTDLNLSGEMAVHNIEAQDALGQLYKAISASNKLPEYEELSRMSAVTMALMMTKYSARTTSTVSQAYSAGENEKTIDVLAKELDDALRKMTTLAASKEASARALDSAWSKWEFIRESYINYNENRVNFVVNLYSRKIIDLLDESAASF